MPNLLRAGRRVRVRTSAIAIEPDAPVRYKSPCADSCRCVRRLVLLVAVASPHAQDASPHPRHRPARLRLGRRPAGRAGRQGRGLRASHGRPRARHLRVVDLGRAGRRRRAAGDDVRAARHHAAVVAGWATPRIPARRREPRAARPTAQVYALSLDGGEPTALTSMPEGVTTFALGTRWPAAGRRQQRARRRQPDAGAGPPAPQRRAHRVARARSARDGTGFSMPAAAAGCSSSRCATRPAGRRVAAHRPGTAGDQGAVWSPDGTRVYFTAETAAEPDYAPPRVVLMEAPVDGGPLKEVAAVDGAISRPSPSPDGTRVAFIAVAQRTAGAVVQPARSLRRRSRVGRVSPI